MTNDTHLRTRDIFASSLKHALMYSILYKHAVSACMNYVYRQKLHTNGLLDCFHVAFSLVLLHQQKKKIMWDEKQKSEHGLGYIKKRKEKIRSYNFQQRNKYKSAFIKSQKVAVLSTFDLHWLCIFCTQSTGCFCCWCWQTALILINI